MREWIRYVYMITHGKGADTPGDDTDESGLGLPVLFGIVVLRSMGAACGAFESACRAESEVGVWVGEEVRFDGCVEDGEDGVGGWSYGGEEVCNPEIE